MYDEKKIADSLRVCKEAKTFYQTGVFDNPKNVFDLDTFLPAADEVKENTHKAKYDEEFLARLQEAIEYGNTLRKQRGQQSVQEVAAQLHVEKIETDKKETANARKMVAATELSEQILSERDNYLKQEEDRKQVKAEIEQIADKQYKKQQKAEQKRKEKVARNKAKSMQMQQDENEEEDEEDLSFGRILLQRFTELVICVAIAYGLSAAFNHFIGTHTIVDGTSMEATLHNEDVLAVNKIGYALHEPERYDIIVFAFDDESYYIKRIIGLPGETVKIVNGIIYIDGSVLDEQYGLEEMHGPDDNLEEVTLGADEYFVLGDNRNNSEDSRSPEVGLVKKDSIIGKACFRLYPFDTMGALE